jgi:hypothetical protein
MKLQSTSDPIIHWLFEVEYACHAQHNHTDFPKNPPTMGMELDFADLNDTTERKVKSTMGSITESSGNSALPLSTRSPPLLETYITLFTSPPSPLTSLSLTQS